LKRLEDLSLTYRILLAAAVVIVTLLILFILNALFGEDAQAQLLDQHPSPYDARMLELDRDALDDAYHDTMMHLFAVWTRDESGQPGRAIKGANQARRAYLEVKQALDMRSKAIQERK
jgi:hypothetical protein